jgi:hypothetical protein
MLFVEEIALKNYAVQVQLKVKNEDGKTDSTHPSFLTV